MQAEFLAGFGLELVSAMAGADGHGEGIALRRLDKGLRFVGVGEGDVADDVFLDAAQHAQFRFDRHAAGVCLVHDAFGDFGVFIEGFVTGINHHRAVEAGRDAVVTGRLVAVVEMDRKNRLREDFLGGADHRFEIAFVGVFPRARG